MSEHDQDEPLFEQGPDPESWRDSTEDEDESADETGRERQDRLGVDHAIADGPPG